MKLLAIDTSTELASVALSLNNQIFVEEQDNLRQHAQFLLPMIERLLAKAQMPLNQLDGIVFGSGPGSFTGLRITCSIAKALAYTHDLPLFPVSSLMAIAEAALQDLPKETNILAMLDARMHQVYWQYFTKNSFAIPQVSSPIDIDLPTYMPLCIAGVGFEPYIAQLPQVIQDRIVKKMMVYPHAAAMLACVAAKKIQPVDASMALPMYVRNQVTQGEGRG